MLYGKEKVSLKCNYLLENREFFDVLLRFFFVDFRE